MRSHGASDGFIWHQQAAFTSPVAVLGMGGCGSMQCKQNSVQLTCDISRANLEDKHTAFHEANSFRIWA